MYKILSVLITLFLIVLAYTFFGEKKINKKPLRAEDTLVDNGFFKLTKLEPEILAQAGQILIKEAELNSEISLQALESEKREIAIIQVYKKAQQQGLQNPKVHYFLEKPQRSLESLFNQYGLPVGAVENVSFEDPQGDTLAVANGKNYTLADIKKDNYRWSAVETKIFYKTLKIIKAKVERLALARKVKLSGLKTEEFIKKEILLGDGSIIQEERQKKISQYLRDNVISLPVAVNLKRPQFSVEFKPDWTPSKGPLESVKKVLVFSDFYNESSRIILSNFEQLSGEYPEVYFGFRPLFPRQNQYQNLLAEVGFCVWALEPSKYWSFMGRAVHVKANYSFEKNIYRQVEESEISLQPIKDCFYNQEHKKVVKYHLDYADYLDMQSGPIILLDGKVFTGGISLEFLRKILSDL